MGGCQNYGPFLGPDYNTAPDIWGTQKGAIILTTTHVEFEGSGSWIWGLGIQALGSWVVGLRVYQNPPVPFKGL